MSEAQNMAQMDRRPPKPEGIFGNGDMIYRWERDPTGWQTIFVGWVADPQEALRIMREKDPKATL